MEQNLRLLRLRVATKLMMAVAFFTVLYVVLSVLLHADPESRVIPTQQVDTNNMQAGEIRTVLWEGRPVIIYRRSDAEQIALNEANPNLLDVNSERSRQPTWAANSNRSRTPVYFVAIGVGTDFSCPIKLLPASDEQFMSAAWSGGFTDECRGARYDFAGRVYRGQYADENLIVPDYRIDGDVVVLGGQ